MHYPEARKEVTKDVVRFIRRAPGMNFVSFTFANEPDLDRRDRPAGELLCPHGAALHLEGL